MKLQLSHQRNRALTRTDVVVVIAVLGFLAILFWSTLARMPRPPSRINCIQGLKQIGLAFRLWAADHNDKYPMAVSATNGGAMELVAAGNVAACFQVMSNELSTTRLLVCPQDTRRTWATNFNILKNANLSYFLNPDAVEIYPQMILDGDDNLTVNGTSAKPGFLTLWTNDSAGWTKDRHGRTGFLGMADCSVQHATSNGLHFALTASGVTNRWVIP